MNQNITKQSASSIMSEVLPIDIKGDLLLICPECHSRIPLITQIINEAEIKVLFKCQCSIAPLKMNLYDYFVFLQESSLSSDSHYCVLHSSKSDCYCVDCVEWLCEACLRQHNPKYPDHCLLHMEVDTRINCPSHPEKPINSFCQKCNTETCDLCKGSAHLYHPITNTNQYIKESLGKLSVRTETDLHMQFNTKMQYYLNIKEKRLKELTAMIEQLKIIMEETNKEHEKNLLKNIHLFALSKVVYSQLFHGQKIPNVIGMQNIHFVQKSFEICTQNQLEHNAILAKINEGIKAYQKEKADFSQKDLLFDRNRKFEAPTTFELEGHTDWVKSALQISDTIIVSCSYDKTIRVWNLIQQKCVSVLKGHKDWIRKVIILDTNIIASCSDDTTIKAWNLGLDESMVSIQGHMKAVYNIIRMRNGNVVSASEDMTIKVWKIMQKELLNCFEGHSGIVSSLDMLPDGRLVSGSWDKTIRIWNMESKEKSVILKGHQKYVHCVITIDLDTIASCSEDKTIKLWLIKDQSCKKTLIGHTDSVMHIVLLRDGRLVSGSMDKTIRIWDIMKEVTLNVLTGHKYSVRYVMQLKDNRILSCSDDCTIKIWT